MALYTLVYVSEAPRPISETGLMDILETSKRNNREAGITGILLYRDRYFMQVLEGEKDAVLGLYRTIAADQRHHRSRIIYQREINERAFGDWEMGFKDLGTMDVSQLEGYSDFLNQPLTDDAIVDNPNRVHLFLELFRQQSIN